VGDEEPRWATVGDGQRLAANLEGDQALPSVTSARGRFVVYPVWHEARMCVACGCTPAVSSSVSSDTPSQCMANLDQVVTQWMSPS